MKKLFAVILVLILVGSLCSFPVQGASKLDDLIVAIPYPFPSANNGGIAFFFSELTIIDFSDIDDLVITLDSNRRVYVEKTHPTKLFTVKRFNSLGYDLNNVYCCLVSFPLSINAEDSVQIKGSIDGVPFETIELTDAMNDGFGSSFYKMVIRYVKGLEADPNVYDAGLDGTVVTGWHAYDGMQFYFNEYGQKHIGLHSEAGETYFLDKHYGMVNWGWYESIGKWYYFDTDGHMLTGWLQDSGKQYYLYDSGVKATGWLKHDGKWYYLNVSGEMVLGWNEINAKWYHFDNNGAMTTGWLQDSGKWYYLYDNGSMATGWLKLGHDWYYLNGYGQMVTGQYRVGNKGYTFDQWGRWLN